VNEKKCNVFFDESKELDPVGQLITDPAGSGTLSNNHVPVYNISLRLNSTRTYPNSIETVKN
jgi:hypothetical protein